MLPLIINDEVSNVAADLAEGLVDCGDLVRVLPQLLRECPQGLGGFNFESVADNVTVLTESASSFCQRFTSPFVACQR